MAAAGVERAHTELSGDGTERVPIKSEAIGNTRAAHPHLGALDTVGDIQTDRDPDVPLPQAGALHGPPDSGRLAYRSSPAADAHVPSDHTSAAGDARATDPTTTASIVAPSDHDATDVDRLDPRTQPVVDVNASPSKQRAGHHDVVHVPHRRCRRTTHGPGRDRRRSRLLPGVRRSARPQPRTPREPDRYRQRWELLVPDLVTEERTGRRHMFRQALALNSATGTVIADSSPLPETLV